MKWQSSGKIIKDGRCTFFPTKFPRNCRLVTSQISKASASTKKNRSQDRPPPAARTIIPEEYLLSLIHSLMSTRREEAWRRRPAFVNFPSATKLAEEGGHPVTQMRFLARRLLPPRRVASRTDGGQPGCPTDTTVLTNPVPCFRVDRRTGRRSGILGTGAVSRFKLLLCRAGSPKISSLAPFSLILSRPSLVRSQHRDPHHPTAARSGAIVLRRERNGLVERTVILENTPWL